MGFSVPFLLESLQLMSGLFRGRNLVDRTQIGGHRLAILPTAEVHRMPDQMNDAGLDRGLGKAAVVASGSP